ncbi:MAG: type II toxin-antitoxin system TacA family antitoxin [Acidimicrobiales bacterium]
MTTTARLEMRVPHDRAELIRRAAAARGESVTGFVLQAATRAAEEELAISRETLVPSEFFDDLINALDATEQVSGGKAPGEQVSGGKAPGEQVPDELADLARRPRRFERG